MAALRLVLVLLLSVAGDLAVPPLLEAMDGVEESEELLHTSRSRRPVRMVREVSVPSSSLQIQARSLAERVLSRPPARRALPGGQGRKIPSLVADSAPASDDH